MSMNGVVDVLFGIIPVLDQIKQSIERSTGTIPRAATQLNNVSQATEMATVEILNTLDRMTGRIEVAESAVSTLRSGGGNLDESLQAIGKSLEDTRQDSMNIAMALQVQDITSQQIAGVSDMIESVRRQLLEALGQLAPGEKPADGQPQTQVKVYDSNASFTNSGERQESADEIVKQFKQVDHE
jgi:chemotaxis regulatin CheY-phosphate phosphatase CheZ